MKTYLVIRYEDCCHPREYGVNDSYSLIGIFTDKQIADIVKEKAEASARETDFEGEYDYRATIISIIEVETNKVYDREKEIYLGGSLYIS